MQQLVYLLAELREQQPALLQPLQMLPVGASPGQPTQMPGHQLSVSFQHARFVFTGFSLLLRKLK